MKMHLGSKLKKERERKKTEIKKKTSGLKVLKPL
jgi:hypothetical protein